MYIVTLIVMSSCLFSCGHSQGSASFETYEGYSLYGIYPETCAQEDTVRKTVSQMGLNVWFAQAGPDSETEVLVSKDKISKFLKRLEKKKIKAQKLIEKVSILIEEEKERMKARMKDGKIPFDKDDFNTYDAMMDQLDEWVKLCPAKGLKCEIETIGTTHEKRAIKLFRICKRPNTTSINTTTTLSTSPQSLSTTPLNNSSSSGRTPTFTPPPTLTHEPTTTGNSTKDPMTTSSEPEKNTTEKSKAKDIWVDCLIHAREWITGPTCMKMICKLINEYGVNNEVTDLVDRFWWNIIPVVNPDGYQHTWTKERLWRKNREPTFKKPWIGIDLNRNFDTKERCNEAKEMSSRVPKEETYCGYEPIKAQIPFKNYKIKEAAEMKAVENKLLSGDLNVLLLLNLHSYGRMWLAPYGYAQKNALVKKPKYRCVKSADNNLHVGITQMAAGASAASGGFKKIWKGGNSCKTIYADSGSLTDFAYDTAKIVHSYAVEMRGKNQDFGRGFLVKKHQIQPAFDEIWVALTRIIDPVDQSIN